LLTPFSVLFNKIYTTQKIPEQWKVSKIIPIFKKGNVNLIENYRPIANLCSASKIFEKLILKQFNYLESKNSLDLTGKQQHGFKKIGVPQLLDVYFNHSSHGQPMMIVMLLWPAWT
jgi:hypothetical protein